MTERSGVLERLPIHRVADAYTRRHRRVARRLYAAAYGRGTGVECPICGWTGSRFIPAFGPRRPNRICPSCNASERYRALAVWFGRLEHAPGAHLVEIAPIGLVERMVEPLGFTYTSLDLMSRRARTLGDLCDLPYGTATVDVLVCLHVLEHVADDAAAVSEIARVIRPGGQAILVVPYERHLTATFEDPTTPVADRRQVYGQSDHVRSYGLDVTERFRAAGVAIEELPWSELFDADTRRRHALDGDDDRFWICRPA